MTTTKPKKAMNYTLWAIQVLLALLFLFAGGMKLILPIADMTKDVPMPGWFLRFIGVAEALGATALIPLAVGLLLAFIVHGRGINERSVSCN